MDSAVEWMIVISTVKYLLIVILQMLSNIDKGIKKFLELASQVTTFKCTNSECRLIVDSYCLIKVVAG